MPIVEEVFFAKIGFREKSIYSRCFELIRKDASRHVRERERERDGQII
jgi:hypothetical protein